MRFLSGLSGTDKEDMGLKYVLDELSILTGLGRERLNRLVFFDCKSQNALVRELENVKAIVSEYGSAEITGIANSLTMVKDLRKTVESIRSRALDQTELFELKCFLIISEDIRRQSNILVKRCNVTDIELCDTKAALDVLDFDGKMSMTFFIDSKLSKTLENARNEKAAIERKMHELSLAGNSEGVAELRKKRGLFAEAEAEEEAVVKNRLTEQLRPFADLIEFNLEVIGYLDILIAKANCAKRFGAVMPEITEETTVVITKAFNPYVCDILARAGKTFTPVSVELKRGTTVITGANMGGKSVSLKTFALNAALAMLGFFVFAEDMRLCVFDDISLIFDDGESVKKGLSSFGGQVIKLNNAVRKQKAGRNFFVADEFAGGTNPQEGRLIVKSVANYFNKRDCVAVMTTHFDDVITREIGHYSVVGLKNANMNELRKKLALNPASSLKLISEAMDYSLQKACYDENPPRDAFNICALLGAEEEITQRQSW